MKRLIAVGVVILSVFLLIVLIYNNKINPVRTEQPISKEEYVNELNKKGMDESAEAMAVVGIEYFGYKNNDFCIYVREYVWDSVPRLQQAKLLLSYKEQWAKITKTDKSRIRIINYKTGEILFSD